MLKNKNFLKIFVAVLFIIIPWFNGFFSNDLGNLPELNQASVSFYQNNSCKISSGSFLINNSKLDNIEIRFDSSSELACHGKVKYIEPTASGYVLFVGMHTLISIAIQSTILLIFISLIKKNPQIDISYSRIIFIPTLFLFHFLGESEFYIKNNLNFSTEISFNNYLLMSYFLSILIISYFVSEICSSRQESLILYFPFVFLFQGVVEGTNINLFIIILIFFGLQNISNKKSRVYNIFALLFIVFAVNNKLIVHNYFDIDKLRGFSSSSSSSFAVIFWSISIVLLLNGIYFLVANSNKFDYKILIRNLILSGFLVVFFGLLSSSSLLINRLTYLFFGQNKVSSESTFSVSGNSWRGFSPSAEMIGEFYGLILLISLLLFLNKKISFKKYEYIFFVFIIYGFIRANSVASIISLIALTLLILVKRNIRNLDFRIIIYLFFIGSTLIMGYFILRQNTYFYMSQSLINEGLSYSNVNQSFIDKKDYLSVLYNDSGSSRISTSLKFLTKTLTDQSNFRNVPNFVALLSVFSLFINRAEKWGIFFAKYDPEILEFLFGYGGLNLVNYNFDNSIVTPGLVLPHSSMLGILVFYGIIGLTVFLCSIIFLLYKNKTNYVFYYSVIYLLINFIKSDSVMYFSSFLMFFTLIFLPYSKKTEVYE